jgi:outer membrane protein OmpA-like peptidoglycan-associated protein
VKGGDSGLGAGFVVFGAGRTRYRQGPDHLAIDASATSLLNDIVWTIRNSGPHSVQVTGYSDTSGTSAAANRKAALRRAQNVAQLLQQSGIDASASADYPVPGAALLERESGRAQFRRADITLSPN